MGRQATAQDPHTMATNNAIQMNEGTDVER